MKKEFVIYYLLALVFVAACSDAPKNKQEEETLQAPSDLMKEAPPYDASEIDPDAPVAEVNLKATGNNMAEMRYDQKEIRVRAGTTVKLRLTNEGSDPSMVHNFVLIEEGSADKVGPASLKAGPDANYVPAMRQVLVASGMAMPGETVEVTFPAPAAGNYDFICTYPGHYQIMNGRFIVE